MLGPSPLERVRSLIHASENIRKTVRRPISAGGEDHAEESELEGAPPAVSKTWNQWVSPVAAVGKRVSDSTNDITKDGMVIVAFFLTLIVANSFARLVITRGIDPHFNAEKQYTEYDTVQEVYVNIAKEVVPFMKRYYRTFLLPADSIPLLQHVDDGAIKPEEDSVVVFEPNATCLSYWASTFTEHLNLTHTTPAEVKRVLQDMRLYDHPFVRCVARKLLRAPFDMRPMLNQSVQCLSNNKAVVQMACEAIADPTLLFTVPNDIDGAAYRREALTLLAIVDVLIAAMHEEVSLGFAIADVQRIKLRQELEEVFKTSYAKDKAVLEFVLQKYGGIAESTFAFATTRAAGYATPGSEVDSRSTVMLNILEAARLDVAKGLHDNANVGMAL
eukprot:3598780-Pyramimonas_sp.AAC.1